MSVEVIPENAVKAKVRDASAITSDDKIETYRNIPESELEDLHKTLWEGYRDGRIVFFCFSMKEVEK